MVSIVCALFSASKTAGEKPFPCVLPVVKQAGLQVVVGNYIIDKDKVDVKYGED